jgi:hypothetical protein
MTSTSSQQGAYSAPFLYRLLSYTNCIESGQYKIVIEFYTLIINYL